MKKIGESKSGIFTIKEYELDEKTDYLKLLAMLQAGPCRPTEVVTYVFGGEDPVGVDAKSFSPEEFAKIWPQLSSYGPELAFDYVVRTDGDPLTVELTQGERIVTTNSLDGDLELEDLLGEVD